MARDRRWLDQAVEVVLELNLCVDRALEDGVIDTEEAAAIRALSREALLLVQRAEVAERIAAAFLRTGGVNPYLRRQAEGVGLHVVEVSDLEAA